MMDEFDLEAYNPRPINKGLGLQQKERERVVYRPPLSPPKEASSSSINSLRPFYDTSALGTGQRASLRKRKVETRANPSHQFFAWAIDLGCLLIFMAFTLIATALLAEALGQIKVSEIITTVSRLNWMLYLGIFFAVNYLLYFTYADLNTTLGKRIFSLKLVAKNNLPLTSGKTLCRSLTVLCSLPLLGIPSLFDFQGELSDTKALKNSQG